MGIARGSLALLALAAACGVTDNDALPGVSTAHVFWQVNIEAVGPPAMDDSSVYFTTRDDGLAAVNRATGQLRWMSYSGPGGGPPYVDTPAPPTWSCLPMSISMGSTLARGSSAGRLV